MILAIFHVISLIAINELISVDGNRGELCGNNSYSYGKWVKNHGTVDDTVKKSFRCCQNEDVGKIQYCGDHEVPEKGGMYYKYDDLIIAPDRACLCDIVDGTVNNISSRESYKWVPDNCHLVNFHGEKFCDLLGERRILLIGDSLMHQMASSLMNFLVTHDAKCINQISYGKTSHLLYQVSNPKGGHVFNKDQNMKLYFDENNGADICIVNTGAHLKDDGDLYSMWENIQPWVNEYRVKHLAV